MNCCIMENNSQKSKCIDLKQPVEKLQLESFLNVRGKTFDYWSRINYSMSNWPWSMIHFDTFMKKSRKCVQFHFHFHSNPMNCTVPVEMYLFALIRNVNANANVHVFPLTEFILENTLPVCVWGETTASLSWLEKIAMRYKYRCIHFRDETCFPSL